MKIENSEAIDAWLFEHSQILGHRCTGIKEHSPEGELINFAWKDETTGEIIGVVYS